MKTISLSHFSIVISIHNRISFDLGRTYNALSSTSVLHLYNQYLVDIIHLYFHSKLKGWKNLHHLTYDLYSGSLIL